MVTRKTDFDKSQIDGGVIMEKVKAVWVRGLLDDSPKTKEEVLDILRSYLEYSKEKEEKAAKESAKK